MTETDAAIGLAPISDGSQLCTQCGLCCTGAIHDSISVERGELEHLTSLNLPVGSWDDELYLPLPCARYADGLCTIYDQRPRSCARYRCQLLRDVNAGSIPMSDALQIVKTGKEKLADVQALFPSGAPHARQFVGALQAREGQGQSDARKRLKVLALMHYVDRYFRQPKEGAQLSSHSLSPNGETTS